MLEPSPVALRAVTCYDGRMDPHAPTLASAAFRRMRPRDPDEARAATTLELLYDLCFVVAIAQAAAALHHAIAHGHGADGALRFGVVFFAVWWAWNGFAWFASAFDPDDVPYRLKVFVQMVGVLVVAAGVPRAFEHYDFGLVTYGYVIMRVGLVAQWVRAAIQAPARRRTALRYAISIIVLQVGWIALLAVPHEQWLIGFCVLAPLELLGPIWAERAGPTTWHAHHITERYGLLTIITIGESVLAATLAIQAALDEGHVSAELVAVIASAPVIVFTMWWLYFAHPAHVLLDSTRRAFLWGYGHYFIFGAAATIGAGIAVAVDQATHRAHLSAFWAGQAVAIPVVVFLMSLWILVVQTGGRCASGYGPPLLASAAILAAPLLPMPIAWIALVLVALTAGVVVVQHRAATVSDRPEAS